MKRAALVPPEPAEIAALRARLQNDPNDSAARILFVWRCVGYREELAAAWGAMKARFDELRGSPSGSNRAARQEIAARMAEVSLWIATAQEEFTESCDRIKDIPDGALLRALRSLRDSMKAADFGGMYDALGMADMVDAATVTMPDRTRLNALRFRAFDPDAEARDVFLALDAIAEYMEALTEHADRMNVGEVAESPEWRRIASEWFATMTPEVGDVGRLIDGIDHRAQTRALAGLREELAPEAYDRLYQRCGFAPV